MNGTLQIELKQIQNRNQFFDQMLVESKKYLNELTDFQAEYLCLFPNKILYLDLIETDFRESQRNHLNIINYFQYII